MSLEKKISPWLRQAYKEEWPVMGSNLISNGLGAVAGSITSLYADYTTESDAIISGVATIADITTYWASFIPQLLWRDRHALQDASGKCNKKRMIRKIPEYISLAGILETTYIPTRFFCQYYLQKKGLDPPTASMVTQVGLTTMYTLLLPPLRYALRRLFSEKQN